MMISPFVLLTALYKAWGLTEGVPLYIVVPHEKALPYGVIQIDALQAGNGLPDPFFYTEGQAVLDVWSAHEGVQQLQTVLSAVQQHAPTGKIRCATGTMVLGPIQQIIMCQLPDQRHKWRQGRLEIPFSYQAETK